MKFFEVVKSSAWYSSKYILDIKIFCKHIWTKSSSWRHLLVYYCPYTYAVPEIYHHCDCRSLRSLQWYQMSTMASQVTGNLTPFWAVCWFQHQSSILLPLFDWSNIWLIKWYDTKVDEIWNQLSHLNCFAWYSDSMGTEKYYQLIIFVWWVHIHVHCCYKCITVYSYFGAIKKVFMECFCYGSVELNRCLR